MNAQQTSTTIIAMMLSVFVIAQQIQPPIPPPPTPPFAKHLQTSFGKTTDGLPPNGSNDAEDWILNVKQTKDGGYIACGFSQTSYITGDPCNGSSTNNIPPYNKETNPSIVKLNAHGQVEWEKTYSAGEPSKYGYMSDIIELSDGSGFAAIGHKRTNFTGYPTGCIKKLYYVRIDINGNIISEKHIGYVSSTMEDGIVVPQGGSLVEVKGTPSTLVLAYTVNLQKFPCTFSDNDIALINIDLNGNTIYWQHSFDGGVCKGDDGGAVKIYYSGGTNPDGTGVGSPLGFIIAATQGNATGSDAWIIKTDMTGNKILDKTINAPAYPSPFYQYTTLGPCSYPNSAPATILGNSKDEANSIEQTSDGNIIVSISFNHYDLGFGNPSCSSPYGVYGEEYMEADAALAKLDISTLDYTAPGFFLKNVAHMSGEDFQPKVKQTFDGGFLLSGSTADPQVRLQNTFVNMLLVKTNPNGIVQHSLPFMANNTALSTYNCGLAMNYCNDGGVIMSGNNGANDDDYIFLKLYPDCQTNIPYAPPVIGTNTIWNTSGITTVRGTVRIKSGKKLTITGSSTVIEFADTRQTNDFDFLASNNPLYPDAPTRIIVESGGTLIVENGATLRGISSCSASNMWEGIQVWGDPNLKQTSATHGTVILRTGAIIKDALYGIMADESIYDAEGHVMPIGNNTANPRGGGIIKANNSNFINCRTGVYLSPYYYSDGDANATQTSFAGCSFKNDAPLADPDFITNDGIRLGTDAFVSMEDYHGVKFAGNTFKCTLSVVTNIPVQLRATGIRSLDASYRVTSCDIPFNIACSPSNPCCYFNTFQNLSTGIDASATFLSDIYVDGNSFTGNFAGIRLNGINNTTTITRNQFTGIGGNTPKKGYGIYLGSCTGYKIEENKFQNSPGISRYGTIVNSSGVLYNEIYKNTYNGVAFGTQSQQTNSGLQIKCNQNSGNNVSDISVTSGAVSNPQGACNFDPKSPAGNTFSHTCFNPTGDIWANTGVASFTYNHHSGSTTTPQCYSSSIVNLPVITNRNRIQGISWKASGQWTAKPKVIRIPRV
ncbi:MAG: hypothetical protein HY841_14800 [Bacteroidetes bacterium]|nr:hypothetical protein [Bacteroidota bacterium]